MDCEILCVADIFSPEEYSSNSCGVRGRIPVEFDRALIVSEFVLRSIQAILMYNYYNYYSYFIVIQTCFIFNF